MLNLIEMETAGLISRMSKVSTMPLNIPMSFKERKPRIKSFKNFWRPLKQLTL